eukprot:TRINITY_DN12082_c0_g1_i2.p1 TRINITY_DN12082_c0_g1~~TRINITY_DN12082_c0_g1_i2.p1  ORF type:complete len:143 (-),score=20.62 TRINITY_DN12082_c0_g1_i2:243-671(-)
MIGSVLCGLERGGANKNFGRRVMRGLYWSKRGPRSYYKGRGAISLGKVNRKAYFKYDPKKLPVFVVPDLTDFPLKPYVARNTPLIKVSPPSVDKINLDLDYAEVDVLDIVAPQHKAMRNKQLEEMESRLKKLEEDASKEVGM